MDATTANAEDLLSSALVWDNHGCMPLRHGDTEFLPQLERYRDAGVNVVSLNVGWGEQGIEDHVRVLANFRHWIGSHGDRYQLAHSVADIEAAQRAGKLAICFDIEGMQAVGGQLAMVELYYDLGVRWMLIAYNSNNEAGGGCQDDDPGLTALGRAIIEEMNRVGMVVCCSHAGYRTALEAIEHSRDPVIFSHSNPRALADHPRNIPDHLMRACAARGGVIGINGFGLFLGDRTANPLSVVRHLDYAIGLVGEDHVGLGLDTPFDPAELEGWAQMMRALHPAGGYEGELSCSVPEDLKAIVVGLKELGHSDSALAKVLGGNFLRIARQVWR
jgi:membrane dipeptidase